MILFIATAFLLILYSILIAYYFYGWSQIPEFNGQVHKDWQASEKITVIVPARNESARIGNCIEALLSQSYPRENLEIIVIDDHSEDNTAEIVESYSTKGVRLIKLKEEIQSAESIIAYKKKAIETAISKSSGSLIIATDADCLAGPEWVNTVAAFHHYSNSVFIVAPVKIKPRRSFLSLFESLDFAILQGITAAAVFRKFHSMCNGANLAYEKKAFESVDGFDSIDHIASGDDMLLMHKIVQKYPGRIGYLKSVNAIVETQTATSWKSFFQQRIRWASKADQYNDKKIFIVLVLVYLLNLGMLLLLIGSTWERGWLLFFAILLFYKTLSEWWFTKSILKYFGLQRLMPWFPFLQPLHIIYTVVSGFFGKFGTYEWKGRRVK